MGTDTITFGKGAHFCVGAALARLEAQIVLGQLLECTSKIEAAEVGQRAAESPGAAPHSNSAAISGDERVPLPTVAADQRSLACEPSRLRVGRPARVEAGLARNVVSWSSGTLFRIGEVALVIREEASRLSEWHHLLVDNAGRVPVVGEILRVGMAIGALA